MSDSAAESRLAGLAKALGGLPPRSLIVIDDADVYLSTQSARSDLLYLLQARADDITIVLVSSQPHCLTELVASHPVAVSLIEWQPLWPSTAEVREICAQKGLPAEAAARAWKSCSPGWLGSIQRLAERKAGAAEDLAPVLNDIVRGYFMDDILGQRLDAKAATALTLCSGGGVLFPALVQEICPEGIGAMSDEVLSACEGFLRVHSRHEGVVVMHPLMRRTLFDRFAQECGAANAIQIRLGIIQMMVREGLLQEAVCNLAAVGDEGSALNLAEQMLRQASPLKRYQLWTALLRGLHDAGVVPGRNWASLPERLDDAATAGQDGSNSQPDDRQLVLARHASLDSWLRGLHLVQYGADAAARLDAYATWLDEQQDLIEGNPACQQPDMLCATAALHVIRRPGQSSTIRWIDSALVKLTAQVYSPVPTGPIAYMAFHLLMALERTKLDLLKNWWLSTQMRHRVAREAARFGTLLEGMTYLVHGQLARASARMRSLLLRVDDPGAYLNHEVMVLAACAWLGIDISDPECKVVQFGPDEPTSVLSCRVDLTGANMLIYAARELQSPAQSPALLKNGTWIAMNTLVVKSMAAFVGLAMLQIHAVASRSTASADAATEALDVVRRTSDRLPLLGHVIKLIECYEQALKSLGAPDHQQRHTELLSACSAIGAELPVHATFRSSIRSMLAHHEMLPKARPVAAPAAAAAPRTEVVSSESETPTQPLIKIGLFGDFVATYIDDGKTGGQPIKIHGKLAYLLQMILIRGLERPMRIDEICDEMWPDVNGDSAKSNFDSAIHRLRKSLQSNASIIVDRGRVRANWRYFDVDARYVHNLQDVNIHELSSGHAGKLGRYLLTTMSGPLIVSQIAHAGTRKVARQIESILVTVIMQLGKRLQQDGETELALRLYERMTSQVLVDPGIVFAWRQLLGELGRHDQIEGIEHRYSDVPSV
ncbi:MAG: hypothetical protein Q7T63_12640 [Burkholderiaceae bacterium]|nr:hypothetical protein [Burkholderiaceae bacterium]